MVAFKLVVKVVAKPLLRLLRRKPPKPPPGPPKTKKTKQTTKQNNKKSLFSSDPGVPKKDELESNLDELESN